jgi:hypothetical protein
VVETIGEFTRLSGLFLEHAFELLQVLADTHGIDCRYQFKGGEPLFAQKANPAAPDGVVERPAVNYGSTTATMGALHAVDIVGRSLLSCRHSMPVNV